MTWTLYRWVWRLHSPLHLGTTPAGSLNRTRLYIPARALWGALTAELARRRCPSFPDYQGTGKELSENCRFSYLFPAEQVNGRWLAWLPRYEEGQGLVWRREDKTDAEEDMPDRVFRSRLLTTRSGTAVDPHSNSAAEGSLREYEVLNPWCRWEDGQAPQPMAFVGYVMLADKGPCEMLSIEELYIGGDTRYGLGQVQRKEYSQAQALFGKPVDLTHKDPQVRTDQLLAHALPDEGIRLLGAMEQLVIWNYGTLGSGPLSWVPGSRVQNDPSLYCILILEDGLWKIQKEDKP